MHPMTEKKQELKDLAKKIRAIKQTRKQSSENYDPGANWKAYVEGRKYRHEHIAYCLVRGRTYEQIEQKVREDNKPNMDIVNKLYEALKAEVDKANAEWELNHPLFIQKEKEVVNG